jgi:hypothetical protein
MAYHVDASGQYAGIGVPGPYGWEWPRIDGSGAEIKRLIADNGVQAACSNRKELLGGINCTQGKLNCQPVGTAHGIEALDPATLLYEEKENLWIAHHH